MLPRRLGGRRQLLDEDCDGADGIFQRMVEPFGDPAGNVLEWGSGGGATYGSDAVSIPASGYIRFFISLPIASGAPAVATSAVVVGSCTIQWTIQPSSGAAYTRSAALANGTGVATFGAIPAADFPLSITQQRVACGAGSSATLDGYVVQNGSVPFAPGEDLLVDWEDTEAARPSATTQHWASR